MYGESTFSGNFTYSSETSSEISNIVYYTVRGFTTVSAVDVTLNYDDQSPYSVTLTGFTQVIGVKQDGTVLVATAPSSVLISGTTYTFVDWNISETSESTTNTTITTTINQDKTLRARYVAFAI
jgi:hypothetical protein